MGSLVGPIGLALSAIGIIGQTVSGIQQAKSQAAFAEAEAESARQAAEFEEAQFRKRAAKVLAKQRAVGAAAGLDISSGSPLLMELESVKEAEIEALNIRRTGKISAEGKKFEARLARQSIPGIAFGGATQVGGSVLSSFLNKPAKKAPKPKPA